MKPLVISLLVCFGVALPSAAQTPVTATCKDGTSFSGSSRSGACRGHGGVQTWGANGPSPSTTPAVAAPSPAQPPPTSTSPSAAAGAGQVWVNTASRVYHCPRDRYYGKTNHGTYMSEAAAKAEGDRPSNGKTCS
jgi:hypothetical protein